MSISEGRRRDLDAALARLQLRYGSGAVGRATGPATPHLATPLGSLSTTFAELDAALASPGRGMGGGIPRGRISELSGAGTSGKATLAGRAVAMAQRERDALAAWVDLGLACDPGYLQRLGVDLNRLLVVRPASGADALGITLHLVESNVLAVLVFDGLAELAVEDPTPGQGQGGLEGTLQRLSTLVAQTQTVLLFLSEPRSQLRSLAHVAALRLSLARLGWLNEGQDICGYRVQVDITKNRGGPEGASVCLTMPLPPGE